MTCSHIKTAIDGRSIAVAFPLKKTGWKNPASFQNMPKSAETESLMRSTHCSQNNLHAGMMHKPLFRYDPGSTRSRLPIPTIVMPYKNASQITIGDRHTVYKRHFTTTNRNMMLKHARPASANPGIAAERARWQHSQARR